LPAEKVWVRRALDGAICADLTDDRRGRGFDIQVISHIDSSVDCDLLYISMGCNESRDDEEIDDLENSEHRERARRGRGGMKI